MERTVIASRRPTARRAHAWAFNFTDLQTGLPVKAGVFALSFDAARDKALAQLTREVGGDKARYAYAGYERLI